MKKRILYLVLALLLVSLLVPSAAYAADEVNTSKVVYGIGTVTYVPLEGGFWGIVSQGQNYEILNLPARYQVEGVRVVFMGITKGVSIYLWGTPLDLFFVMKVPFFLR